MKSTLTDKLTYPNVVATIALVVAVAGIPTAVAVTKAKVKKGSITSKQIKDGSIRATDLQKGAIGAEQLAESGVTSSKIAAGSITGLKLAPITVQGGNNTVATCSIPGGAVLISGGAKVAAAGGLTASYPPSIYGWQAAAAGGTAFASALCLSNTPAP